ncbi:MAG: restriction endonuclease [Bacteroidetes bacterium]|nr:MAG: restriction endonuclease [Bacteroidota bacterium]
MIQTNYNPDVLSCLANLSNDEVFTPPSLVNDILDLLPAELWSNPNAKFLDPVSKSGVFLREMAKRLMHGLETQIPDKQERINHIFSKQLYGIAITDLTALLSRRSVYCSKTANGKYSICNTFDDEQGNIRYERMKHTWQSDKCTYCGASQEVYDREDALETYAYNFIHTDKPEKIFNMKFDVIVGNPPYQLSDAGHGRSASPIYHKFIEQAKKLNPRYLTMIVPARWYAGGKGLDDFREEMLKDSRIRELYDFPDATDVFPGVQIKGGVCYFKWDRDNRGLCKVSSHKRGNLLSVMERPLLDFGAETFIRYNEAISIVTKVRKLKEKTIKEIVSVSKPFGLRTNYLGQKKPFKDCVQLFQNGGIGYVSKDELTANKEVVSKYKVFIPPLGSGSDSFPHPILGKPFLGLPNTACTETYIYIGIFDGEIEAKNLMSYISTKFFRFLVLLNKPAQHATKKVYHFVPMQVFNEPWTDTKLNKKYGLTQDEIAFIESMIRPMDLTQNSGDDE